MLQIIFRRIVITISLSGVDFYIFRPCPSFAYLIAEDSHSAEDCASYFQSYIDGISSGTVGVPAHLSTQELYLLSVVLRR